MRGVGCRRGDAGAAAQCAQRARKPNRAARGQRCGCGGNIPEMNGNSGEGEKTKWCVNALGKAGVGGNRSRVGRPASMRRELQRWQPHVVRRRCQTGKSPAWRTVPSRQCPQARAVSHGRIGRVMVVAAWCAGVAGGGGVGVNVAVTRQRRVEGVNFRYAGCHRRRIGWYGQEFGIQCARFGFKRGARRRVEYTQRGAPAASIRPPGFRKVEYNRSAGRNGVSARAESRKRRLVHSPGVVRAQYRRMARQRRGRASFKVRAERA